MPRIGRVAPRPLPAAQPTATSSPWAASHASSSRRSASPSHDPRIDALDRALRVVPGIGLSGHAVPLPGGRGLARGAPCAAPPPLSRSSESWSPRPSSSSGPASVGSPIVGGNRSMSDRNSSSRKRWASARRLYRPVRADSRSRLIGRSVTIRPTSRLMNASSRCVVQPLAELALDLVQALVQGVEGPELLEEGDRCLLPHPGHAGQVVGGVALQRLVVEHLVRPQAVPLGYPGLVVDDRVGHAHPGREQPDVVVHQLEAVEVAGDDVGVDPVGRCLQRERADDVIGFVALELDDRHAHHGHQLADDRELGPEVVRHRWTTGLVVRVCRETECRPAEVEADNRRSPASGPASRAGRC